MGARFGGHWIYSDALVTPKPQEPHSVLSYALRIMRKMGKMVGLV